MPILRYQREEPLSVLKELHILKAGRMVFAPSFYVYVFLYVFRLYWKAFCELHNKHLRHQREPREYK